MRPDKQRIEFDIVRKMPDGLYEIIDWRGQRRRVTLACCSECEIQLPDYYFGSIKLYAAGAKMCPVCVREYHSRRVSENRLNRHRERRENGELAYQRRAAALILASPAWRDRAAIRIIYEEARRRTRETGIQYHVDHFYPLQGELCCGLHVHQNLRIITAAENYSKNNKHPVDESTPLAIGT